MKYFVTGATGFVGTSLVKQLKDQGHDVVAIARNPDKAASLRDIGVDIQPGDITDKESLRGPMDGVDGIFHVAGWYKVGVRDKSDATRINIEGTRNVLEVMRDLDIPRGVYTSTLAVNSDTHGKVVDETYEYHGSHLTEYDRTKAIAHHQIAQPMIEAGLPLTIVMPGAIYGANDKSATGQLFLEYLSGNLKMIPGKMELCWGHVDDTTAAHIAAMEKSGPGETYIICGPAHTAVEVFDIAESITGIPAPNVVLPPIALSISSKLAGLAEKVVNLPDNYSAEYLRNAAGATYLGDNSKAKRELGFAPRSLEQGLRDVFQE